MKQGGADVLQCPYGDESHCLSAVVLNLCPTCLELITTGKPIVFFVQVNVIVCET